MEAGARVDWYFDFISPFSYLQHELLQARRPDLQLVPKPVLLAGLLGHWGSVGPAEIAPKRTWTFEHCAWLAHRHGIPLVLPAQHPFNPLPLLRLFIAAGGSGEALSRIFHFVWREGHLPGEAEPFAALLQEMQVSPAQLDAPDVKQALRRNGEQAIAQGVFGVPTVVVDNRCFWGLDATDMLLDWLDGDSFFQSAAFRSAQTLAPGIQRNRKS